jgi:hypothetical protein
MLLPPLNDSRKQLALNCCNLRVNHAEEVQLTAARKGQVSRRIRECFGMLGVFYPY